MLIGINGGYFPAICRVCFCLHAAFWHWFSVFFYFDLIFFLKKWFSQFTQSVLGLVFCLVSESSLNSTPGLVLLRFFNSSSPSMIFTTKLLGNDFFNDFGDFYCFAVKSCVRDVISAFRSIASLK